MRRKNIISEEAKQHQSFRRFVQARGSSAVPQVEDCRYFFMSKGIYGLKGVKKDITGFDNGVRISLTEISSHYGDK